MTLADACRSERKLVRLVITPAQFRHAYLAAPLADNGWARVPDVAALLGIHANALCTWAAHDGIADFADLELSGETCGTARIRLRHLVAPHTLPAIAAQVVAGVAVCAAVFALAVLVG